ncbi:hypothetical protein DAPPUDRAFT_101856 [Daphnia pulex]|uniref:Uncharacterized protein n=1 Tax=Daphnia pulex TaxID=6669 RepID=E9GER4_DAPPU|nr:hypothetical protein DAPPUDRAFT_101856 [Daphnia pulex]|eukprot:EFX82033.1 hypothetical protein DAPPUDRAFT_101856 [Daphnia pulex]
MSETPCSGLRCTALFTRAQSSEARPGKFASTTMTSSALICLFFSVAVIISSSVGAAETDLPHVEISNWAIRFGAQMWEIGKQVTRIREIREIRLAMKVGKSLTPSAARKRQYNLDLAE